MPRQVLVKVGIPSQPAAANGVILLKQALCQRAEPERVLAQLASSVCSRSMPYLRSFSTNVVRRRPSS
ncbi:hypothetical protein KOJCDNHJ_02996 [Xanthomonas citri pv. punicae]|nr:hypothetical protein FICKIIDM_03439 [Xanthomonas citri pv. punicae]UIS29582.1 hypothetical protein KOJCDNHJ_02996 [Xanthomonas citri pv. punicae]